MSDRATDWFVSGVAKKLYEAVWTLTGEGSRKQKLADAYEWHIMALAPDQIPAKIKPQFERLVTALTAEDTIARSAALLSEKDVEDLINTMLDMFCQVVGV